MVNKIMSRARFIAGAKCPKCKRVDTIQVIFEEGNDISKCIFCGYTNLKENSQTETKSVINIVTK